MSIPNNSSPNSVSMAPKAPPAALASFTFPPSLSPFATQVKDYLISHPSKRQKGVSCALVFSPSNQLLILQRSATDSMPNLWEVPGGSCDSHETILEGAVRELWEESGLVATEVLRQVGGVPEWLDREKVWCKFSFEVKVKEGMEVVLDNEEHQKFLWVSEEECRSGVAVRGGERTEIEFTTEVQVKTILEGFRLRKEGNNRGL
jgi:8-oxo-dGTP pyrophosphatase MutT (NUDIX family)